MACYELRAKRLLAALKIIGLIWALGGMPVRAEPWGAVDDRLLRSDIELLADFGVLRGPLTAWPINWAQVRGALETADVAKLPAHVRDAMLRIQRLTPGRGFAKSNWGVEIDLAATNEQALVRAYGAQARGDYDAQVRLAGQWGGTSLSVSVGLQDEPFGRNVTFDNAYLAQEVGNWIAYIGTVERWWGAGWNSALGFSTSARPQPQIGIKRNNPDPFTSKWLSWMGPWSFEAFVSVQDDSGGLYDDDLIAGIRLDIQPFKGFSFGIQRALQLCGEDRPCGFNTWIDAVFPFSNADNTGTLNEPGNQMAGFDLRYGWTVGTVAMSTFWQFMAEDETQFFPYVYATLGGVRFTGGLGESGARWEVIAEFSDTLAERTNVRAQRPNVIYQNFIYSDGWRYRGHSLGGSLDNDTRLISVTGQLTDTRNRFYRLTFHNADINSDGTGKHTVSLNNEIIKIVEAETIWPTPFGDVRAEVRLQNDRPNTPDESQFAGAVEISYQVRF